MNTTRRIIITATATAAGAALTVGAVVGVASASPARKFTPAPVQPASITLAHPSPAQQVGSTWAGHQGVTAEQVGSTWAKGQGASPSSITLA